MWQGTLHAVPFAARSNRIFLGTAPQRSPACAAGSVRHVARAERGARALRPVSTSRVRSAFAGACRTMARARSPSGWSGGSPLGREAADDLLEQGRYEKLAEIIRQAYVACRQADDATLAHVLAAARRVCEACRQIRS